MIHRLKRHRAASKPTHKPEEKKEEGHESEKTGKMILGSFKSEEKAEERKKEHPGSYIVESEKDGKKRFTVLKNQ